MTVGAIDRASRSRSTRCPGDRQRASRRAARARRARTRHTRTGSRTSSPAASASASASPARSRSTRQLLVLDEPVSALDVSIQAGVVNLLEDLQDAPRPRVPVHRARPVRGAPHLATTVAVMYLGKIVEIGVRATTCTTRPAHPYTQALLSAVPDPDPTRRAQAQADRARGRRAEPDRPAERLPVPHPLLEGAGHLRDRGAGADRPRPGPPRGLPLRGSRRRNRLGAAHVLAGIGW